MPATVKLPPDSNVTLEAASASHYFEICKTHIYFALGAGVVLIVIRIITAQLRDSQHYYRSTRIRQEQKLETTSWPGHLPSFGSKQGPNPNPSSPSPIGAARSYRYSLPGPPRLEPGLASSADKSDLTVSAPALDSHTGLAGPPWRVLAMDGDVGDHRKDLSASAAAVSRGVSANTTSTKDIRRQHDPSVSFGQRRSGSRRSNSRASRSSASQTSSSRQQPRSSNGEDSQRSKGKGEGKGKEHMTSQGALSQAAQGIGSDEEPSQIGLGSGNDGSWLEPIHGRSYGESYGDASYTAPPWQFSRPMPPSDPLTPPALNDSVFSFESRRLGYAVSIAPGLERSFDDQAKVDYWGSPSAADAPSSSPWSETSIVQRTSYPETVPLGIPIPTPATSASSSMDVTTTSSAAFFASSFPPRTPLLPPPPPGSDAPFGYQFVGGPGGPGIVFSQEEVDLHGNIMSELGDTSPCWTRHTRVYGGGVCLACLGADGEGGFYGDRVPMEDRR